MKGEEFLERVSTDRTVEQAIMAVKKGAYLLKCEGMRRARVCPFRISVDEKFLIWYSGQEEKQLRLSSVTEVIRGQRTVNFQKQLQPDREAQSFSLIYADGKRSIDLICKDHVQADSWYLGLKTIISKCHHSRPFASFRSPSGVQTCANSPAGFMRRKYNLGLLEDTAGFCQVRSLCGSPALSLSKRYFSEGSSNSSDSFYSSESSTSQVHDITYYSNPEFLSAESKNLSKSESSYGGRDIQKDLPRQFASPDYCSTHVEPNENLKDIFIWGEGAGGALGGVVDKSVNNTEMLRNSLFPRLLESAMMLDVEQISLGGKHAALVTKQGEVFCWGEANKGKLGHKVNMDESCPKLVESLSTVHVKSVISGEHQTCAVTLSGDFYAWGDYNIGSNLAVEERSRNQWLPCKLSGPPDGIKVSSVSCGIWHTAVVTTSRQLYTFGDGTFGVLGHGDLRSISRPKEVESLRGSQVKSVACGHWHTAAIVEIVSDRLSSSGVSGKLFTWGDGDGGRLGHGDQEKRLLPTCVAKLMDHDFVQVSCGRTFTVALTKLGKVHTVGSGIHGQLGNPRATDKSIIVVEGKLKDEFVTQIATGSYHTAVLTSRGSIYVWGKGAHGQLGLGDTEDRGSPTLIEALRDRTVENISCGSNTTAAICIHKFVSIGDQTACSRCGVPFGLTRRKHNCYNCGSLICHTCSSNKVKNASLAPNRNKPSRVCDPCFVKLQIATCTNLEKDSKKQLLIPHTRFSDEKEAPAKLTPRLGLTLQGRRPCAKVSQCSEMQSLPDKIDGQKDLDFIPSMLTRMPQWGQVSRPTCFECSTELAPLPKIQALTISPIHSLTRPPESKLSINTAMNTQEFMPESAMLTGEMHRLKNQQARTLEVQCLIRNQKIKECQRELEETRSLAREEAAKCKVANEVIKALAVQLHKLSTRASVGSVIKDGVDEQMPQNAPFLGELNVMKGQQTNDSCGSPIALTDASKPLYEKDEWRDDSKLAHSHPARKEMRPKVAKDMGLEWIEQYELGIYLTFTILPNGQKGLKRVRFSRKHFSEKEAERWWEEHQVAVYEKYDLEGYTKSSRK
ncbi:PH, RCC1 and FYVE domains-containing protein 1 isoform X1 [Syzygium oleosum]|uniref:PH, RCC1 and FYVE domains-containing protein 1 isoform X1 n=1 Tax=Syzygium oleosum TaxID=219896 RepID=UPI0024BBA866|nr:PH, RCC1 and FYVE domains-containing protein 1 isoform X1 [Syzygium oleosum]